jgi:hypothetical protein
MDSSGSGYGPVAGSCENCNELSGSTSRWKFLEYLSYFLKDSGPRN